MVAYVFIDFMIIFLYFLLRKCRIKTKDALLNSDIYYGVIFIILFIFSAFRGDFTTDYMGYVQIYDTFSKYSLKEIISRGFGSYPEVGYLTLQYFINRLFNNVIYMFMISAFIILYANISEIKKFFPTFFLPLLLFVDMGTFYTSFNVMRQILAVSIVIIGCKYIYSQEFIKYVFWVALASLFHSSALIMLPAYFFLNLKLKRVGILWFAIGIVILYISFPFIITFLQKYLWKWYSVESLLESGYSYKNIIRSLFISLPPIIMYNLTPIVSDDDKSKRTNIWLNGTYLYLALSLLGLRVSLSSRFASFFSIFAILAFTQTFTEIKFKSCREKKIVICIITLIVCLYSFVVKSDSGYNPFYFFWQS